MADFLGTSIPFTGESRAVVAARSYQPSHNYVWVGRADGTGIDYFDNNQPITNAQFQAGVNAQGDYQTNVQDIENAYWTAINAGQPAPRGDTGTPEYTGSGSSGSGLSAQQIAAANEKHNANLREIDRAYQEGLLTFKQRQDALAQSRDTLNLNKEEGLSSNSAYFNNVSPDAFQSQQGNYNTKVLDAWQKGMNTADNDQKAIDFAKTNFEQRTNEQRAAENTFNPTSGQYTGGYAYSGGLAANAPELTAINANLPSQVAAKLGAPAWAPNYGGLSTQQKQLQDQQTIDKYLNR